MSKRHFDENGYLHIEISPLTKETVNPYYGHEIPNWQELGIDPEKIYMGYRKGEELQKAVNTFNGIPVLQEHKIDSSENPLKEDRVGFTGTNAVWQAPYIMNALTITDIKAIELIESNEKRELSASYRYDPIFESGTFKGEPYDFIMTNIRANHIALVAEGRAGHDVLVFDKNIQGDKDIMKSPEKLKEAAALFMDALNEFLDEESMEAAHDEDNEYREVMTEAGCDAENPVEAKAFAEGVKYGEKLEKNPDERKKLDREHESEGMKKAMDEAGCDSENEEIQRAFAEGVKYGEKLEKNPDERKKLDREHESKGMKKALGEDEENKNKDDKTAQDEQIKQAETRLLNKIRRLTKASEEVRSVIKTDPLSYDSASDIYKQALIKMGVDLKEIEPSAYGSLFKEVLKRERNTQHNNTNFANDEKKETSAFLKNVKVEN